MNKDDYLARITNYIFEPRFSRALLIDGKWGCGKSFFVNKSLIPTIEKTIIHKSSNTEDGKKDCYKTLFISLYGLTSIESIQEESSQT